MSNSSQVSSSNTFTEDYDASVETIMKKPNRDKCRRKFKSGSPSMNPNFESKGIHGSQDPKYPKHSLISNQSAGVRPHKSRIEMFEKVIKHDVDESAQMALATELVFQVLNPLAKKKRF